MGKTAAGRAGATPFRGRLGKTRKQVIHVTCTCGAILAAEVYRSVNAADDPEVAASLRDATQGPFQTASCPRHDGSVPVHVPVVYHDPEGQRLALVLPEAMRHRELEERARFFEELAAEPEAEIPAYVLEAAVVFGRGELAEWAEQTSRRGAPDAAEARADAPADLERRALDLEAREQALEAREQDLEAREQDLEARERAAAEPTHRGQTDKEREARLRARERAAEERERKIHELEASFGAATVGGELPGHGDGAAPFTSSEVWTEELEAQGSGEAEKAALGPVPEIGQAHGPASPAPAEGDDILASASGGPEGADAPAGGVARAEAAALIDDEDDDGEFGHATIADIPASLIQQAGHDVLSGSSLAGHHWEDDVPHELLDSGELIVADEDATPATMAQGDGKTVVGGRHDVALERWIASGDEVFKRVDDQGGVHLAVAADEDALAELSADDLQLRVILHRLPTYPLVVIAIGSAASIEGEPGDREPYPFLFDVGDGDDAGVLAALGRKFHLELSIYGRDHTPVKKRTVTAGLAENLRYAVSAARDERGRIDPEDRSYTRAVIAFSDPAFDRYGREHPQRAAFREADLTELGSLAGVMRAVATARHFSRPENEDYLLLVRGYPLKLWHERRRQAIARAIEWGVWMGPSLARMAVRDGAVQSRKHLIMKLQRHFSAVTAAPDATAAVDEDAVRSNWEALRREATALGLAGGDVLTSAPRAAPAAGRSQPLVSGTITTTSSAALRGGEPVPDPREKPEELGTAQLVALLEDDEQRRLSAALELARRRQTGAVGAVFSSLLRMTRKEAVEVLGAAVSFGPGAVPYLVEGLAARKAFLRQGCALALGILATEEAIEALSDALVSEPTDIWTEIARALGEAGPPAVMSVVSRLRDRAEEAGPRVSWALAHIAARGHRQPVETLAQGRDPVASEVAKKALGLAERASRDEAGVRGDKTPRDQTVTRAFSRKFFQTAAQVRADFSAPTLPLDEGDVLEARDAKDL